MSFCTWIIQISTPGENIAVDACTTINLHGHLYPGPPQRRGPKPSGVATGWQRGDPHGGLCQILS